MKGWIFGWALLGLSISLSHGAEARPQHETFTGDLSLGISVVRSAAQCGDAPLCPTDPPAQTRFGVAGLSASLGSYIVPQVALVARLASTSFFDGSKQYGNNFYGVGVEFWPHDYVMLGAGVGFGLFGQNVLFSGGDAHLSTGWALDFRVATALAQGTHHDFILGLEALPGFYDGKSVLGFGLTGGWKWY